MITFVAFVEPTPYMACFYALLPHALPATASRGLVMRRVAGLSVELEPRDFVLQNRYALGQFA